MNALLDTGLVMCWFLAVIVPLMMAAEAASLPKRKQDAAANQIMVVFLALFVIANIYTWLLLKVAS